MQAQDNPAGCEPQRELTDDQMAEVGVMLRLLQNDTPDPWTRSELERDIGLGALPVQDALGNLHCRGLIHVTGELVTATKAVRRMHEIDDHF